MGKLITVILISAGLSAAASAQSVPSCNGINANQNVLWQMEQYHKSDVEVLVTGRVERILPDDTRGLPHQKFIIDVGNVPVEIVHNLDLSGRIPLSAGTMLTACGEFIPVGPTRAMVHWTHYDPSGRHADGFVLYQGQVYGARP